MNESVRRPLHKLPVLEGVLPLSRTQLLGDVFAGASLAALAVPEALGYAKIAGMPVVTGLFTLLLPAAVFALFCSSRHLVVGADSATAAIMAASLHGSATAGSPRYVLLASTAALVTGVALLVARMVGLGFVANFLSRTVLVGFLSGVGVSVAWSQVPELLGVHDGSTTWHLLARADWARVHGASALLALAVVVLLVALRKLSRKLPAGLLAVVGAIALNHLLRLDARGVSMLGEVPRGLPTLSWPLVSLADARLVLQPAASMFVVIVAQSAATARGYAAKYDEAYDSDRDLVGLGLANLAAGLSGTFVVNGSPTKTQMVDDAGSRSQLAQLVTVLVVVLVLWLLTEPLTYLPTPALAAIVFVIGVELVDLRGMRAILRVRRHEFVVALLTLVAVTTLDVARGIVFAVLLSIFDHLRHSYAPHNGVLVLDDDGHLRYRSLFAGARTRPGLVIMRFGSSLYYANARHLTETVQALAHASPSLNWFCLDLVAVGDVDYTAGAVLHSLHQQLARRGVRLVFSQATNKVRQQLDKYGVGTAVGAHAFYDEPSDVLRAYEQLGPAAESGPS